MILYIIKFTYIQKYTTTLWCVLQGWTTNEGGNHILFENTEPNSIPYRETLQPHTREPQISPAFWRNNFRKYNISKCLDLKLCVSLFRKFKLSIFRTFRITVCHLPKPARWTTNEKCSKDINWERTRMCMRAGTRTQARRVPLMSGAWIGQKSYNRKQKKNSAKCLQAKLVGTYPK